TAAQRTYARCNKNGLDSKYNNCVIGNNQRYNNTFVEDGHFTKLTTYEQLGPGIELLVQNELAVIIIGITISLKSIEMFMGIRSQYPLLMLFSTKARLNESKVNAKATA
ncbi:15834_t:CDS:1, partial [Racocetra persica]